MGFERSSLQELVLCSTSQSFFVVFVVLGWSSVFGSDVCAGAWQILVEFVTPWELPGRVGARSLARVITLTKIFHPSLQGIFGFGECLVLLK